jgi:hypothetical protein
MQNLHTIAMLLTSSSSANTPAFPGIGGIVWWVICSRRRQQSIGGWLLFYFWQVFSGAVLSTVLFLTLSYKNFAPEIFGTKGDFALFILSVAPTMVLLLVQAAIALILLNIREWEVVKILRVVVLLHVCFAWLGVSIDLLKWQDNIGLALYDAIPMTLWLIYLFRSVRVERVFKHHDWEHVAIVVEA